MNNSRYPGFGVNALTLFLFCLNHFVLPLKVGISISAPSYVGKGMELVKMSRLVSLAFILNLIISTGAFGQAGDDKDGGLLPDSKQDITVVVALAAGGAILGLSTLSFVERPKDHLKNIVVGGALGTIVGVGLVAYNQASKSKNLYNEGGEDRAQLEDAFPKFDTFERYAYYDYHRASRLMKESSGHPFLHFTFNF